MTLAAISAALLEDWLRERYFDAKIDISCSGVEEYTLGELREILDVDSRELDRVAFRDSPSLGGARLRQAVAERFAAGRAERVMATNGSSEAIFLAMAALVRPGDEIVVTAPAYQSLFSIAEALGARLRWWELPAGEDFAPDPDRLAGLLTPRTRAVVVNFPHNPTGATLDAARYEALLELVSRSGCHLLWDGAFAELTYDEQPLPDPGGAVERCLSFGTLSKAYGLPGLRVGWCLAAPALLSEMVRIRDYLTLSVSPLNETIAAAVLERADAVLQPRRRQARDGREVLLRWARDHADVVQLPVPRGGVSAFPLLRDVADVTALCADLASEQGVLVVPGACFGHDQRVRVGFGGPGAELRSGLSLLAGRARDYQRAQR